MYLADYWMKGVSQGRTTSHWGDGYTASTNSSLPIWCNYAGALFFRYVSRRKAEVISKHFRKVVYIQHTITHTLQRMSFLISRFLPLYRKITWTFLVPGPQISGPKHRKRIFRCWNSYTRSLIFISLAIFTLNACIFELLLYDQY